MNLSLKAVIGLDEDVWRLRARHGTSDIFFNQVDGGVGVVDCRMATRVNGIAFPAGVDEFSPYAMMCDPDGRLAYLFGSDLEDFAIELDFTSKRSKRLALSPSGGLFTSVGWLEPNLNVVDVEGFVWRLMDNVIVRTSRSAPQSERGSLIQKIAKRYAIQKMDAMASGLCVFGEDRGATVVAGYVPFQGAPIFVPMRSDAIDLARCGEALFVCYEDGLAGADGRSVLKPHEGERFLAVEAIGTGAPVLAVLVDNKKGVSPAKEIRLVGVEA